MNPQLFFTNRQHTHYAIAKELVKGAVHAKQQSILVQIIVDVQEANASNVGQWTTLFKGGVIHQLHTETWPYSKRKGVKMPTLMLRYDMTQ